MKINRSKLLGRLSLLKPAIKSGGIIPELTNVWLTRGSARAFDGELGVRVDVDIDAECGVPGGILLELLGTSGLEDVSVGAGDDPRSGDECLIIKMGRSVTRLASMASDRVVWPFPDDTDDGTTSIEMSETVLAALKYVLLVDPKHVTRAEHSGVMLHRDRKVVTLVATDSATIAVARAEWGGKSGPVMIIPRAFAEQVARNCAPGAKLTVSQDYIAIDGREARYFSRVVDASKIQDTRAVADRISSGHPDAIPIPAGLKRVMERAKILEGGKDEAVVDVAVRDREISAAGAYRYGALSERIKVKEDHPAAGGMFTAGLVLRGLSAAASISISDDAMIMRSEGGGEMYLVAPRRRS